MQVWDMTERDGQEAGPLEELQDEKTVSVNAENPRYDDVRAMKAFVEFPKRSETSSDDETGELDCKKKDTQEDHELEVMIEKLLTVSDTDKRGCIALPKGPVEEHLPLLDRKEGMELHCEDMAGRPWTFQFRFWTLKHHRTYILQHTLDFVRTNRICAGDVLQLCRRWPTTTRRVVLQVKRCNHPGLAKWGAHKMGSAHSFPTFQQPPWKSVSNVPGQEDISMEKGEGMATMNASGSASGKRKMGGPVTDALWERGWNNAQKRSPHQKRKHWGLMGMQEVDVDSISEEQGSQAEQRNGGVLRRRFLVVAAEETVQKVGAEGESAAGGELVPSPQAEDWPSDTEKRSGSVRKARKAMGRPRRNTVHMEWLMNNLDMYEPAWKKRQLEGSAEEHIEMQNMGAGGGDREGVAGEGNSNEGPESAGLCAVLLIADDGKKWNCHKESVPGSQFCLRHRREVESREEHRLCNWNVTGTTGCRARAVQGSLYCYNHLVQGGGEGDATVEGCFSGDAGGVRQDIKVKWDPSRSSRGAPFTAGSWHGRGVGKKYINKMLGRESHECLGGGEGEEEEGEDGDLLCNKGNGGKTWRCRRKRVPGRAFCEVHGRKVKRPVLKMGEGIYRPTSEGSGRLEVPPEGERCNKSNGAKSWRCSRYRLPGRAFCHVHCTFPKGEKNIRNPARFIAKGGTSMLDEKVSGDGSEVTEKLSALPVPSKRECAFAGGQRPCPLSPVSGHQTCAKHMKPNMMRQARELKKVQQVRVSVPQDDEGWRGRYTREDMMEDFRLHGRGGPGKVVSQKHDKELLSLFWNPAQQQQQQGMLDNMVALAQAADQAAQEDQAWDFHSLHGGAPLKVLHGGQVVYQRNGLDDEAGMVKVPLKRGIDGMDGRVGRDGGFASHVYGGRDMMGLHSKDMVSERERNLSMLEREKAKEREREHSTSGGLWRGLQYVDARPLPRAGSDHGRGSPDEGVSVAVSDLTFVGAEPLLGSRETGRGVMGGVVPVPHWGSASGGHHQFLQSVAVDRSVGSGVTHSDARDAERPSVLVRRPELKGLQLSDSALGGLYRRWAAPEGPQVQHAIPSAAWQDRAPDHSDRCLPVPNQSFPSPVARAEAVPELQSATPGTKGFQLFGVFVDGPNNKTSKESSASQALTGLARHGDGTEAPMSQRVRTGGKELAPQSADESLPGISSSLHWKHPPTLMLRDLNSVAMFGHGDTLESPGVPQQSVPVSRELCIMRIGDGTRRWRCDMLAADGSGYCKEHRQEIEAGRA